MEETTRNESCSPAHISRNQTFKKCKIVIWQTDGWGEGGENVLKIQGWQRRKEAGIPKYGWCDLVQAFWGERWLFFLEI